MKQFLYELLHAGRNLLPIILVVAFFQVLVIQAVPDGLASMVVGLGIVLIGVALFLQGLELGVFPIGRNLSNEFARKGSLIQLLVFGFGIGFSAVIAEPALIAVAEQAENISEGRISANLLRIIVALSVGGVVALGVMRTVLGHSLVPYVFTGYLLVMLVTFFAPEEIVGLAYDSGGVTTNIVTVPLIAALGIGLASSIRGRNALSHGFGLVALAVMVPMISVQLYGIVVYRLLDVPTDSGGGNGDGAAAMASGPADNELPGIMQAFTDLLSMAGDIAPIILVILFCQYVLIKKPIAHLHKVAGGFVMVLLGLYAFVVGLKMGLFPVGTSMAEQLIQLDGYFWIYLFAFAIGFATTMAEPALIAVGKQAEQADSGRVNASTIRILVALGVAIGLTVGVHRLITGGSIHYFVMTGYAIVLVLTLLAPKRIVALAFDLGGVTTSEVTVPLVTALGIGLASQIEGRSVLIDGFGLIAFASIFPIVTVLIYAVVLDWQARLAKTRE